MDRELIMVTIVQILNLLFLAAMIALFTYLVILVIRALKKYVGKKEGGKEKTFVCKPLGEVLKEHRLHCKMTQEFVAEVLGVSRQAVSKWESGASVPSTSNLIALAKLYGVSSKELLRETDMTKESSAPQKK